jgi:hypothetical protein
VYNFFKFLKIEKPRGTCATSSIIVRTQVELLVLVLWREGDRGIQHDDGITVRIFIAVATAHRRCSSVISAAAVVISDVCFRYFSSIFLIVFAPFRAYSEVFVRLFRPDEKEIASR